MKFNLEKIIGNTIHCDTEEKAKELLKFLHENGFKWLSGGSLLDENYWCNHEKNTCYIVDERKIINYGSKTFRSYAIKFEDVLVKEEKMYHNLVFINHGIGKNYLFKVPLNISLKRAEKVYVDTIKGKVTGDCVTNSFIVDEYTAKQIILGSVAYEPLKEVIGYAQEQKGYKCIDFELASLPF